MMGPSKSSKLVPQVYSVSSNIVCKDIFSGFLWNEKYNLIFLLSLKHKSWIVRDKKIFRAQREDLKDKGEDLQGKVEDL